jgi:hypothetical protein
MTVDHLFTELIRRQDALTETDPCGRVLAGALVYCEFGLAAPGQPAHLPLQVPLAAAGADRPRRRRRPPSHIQNH